MRDHQYQSLKQYTVWATILNLIILSAFLIMFAAQCDPVHAADLPKEKVIRAILGEASNQGEVGMLCVACAIQNRGSLKGVYGVTAAHVDKEPAWVWEQAERAYKASLIPKNCLFLGGADHFENISAFGVPPWINGVVETYRFKDHVFYRGKP